MKKTGELLRNAREARGLSLHEIALSLKINSKILKSIEEGDPANLPAKTFLRGFVQSYANYLRLNTEEVLKSFSEEMGSTRPQPLISANQKNDDLSDTDTPTPQSVPAEEIKEVPVKKDLAKIHLNSEDYTKTILFSLLGVVLASLIVITMKIVEKYQREAAPLDTPEVAAISSPQELNPIVPEPETPAQPNIDPTKANLPNVVAPTADATKIQTQNSSDPAATTPTTAISANIKNDVEKKIEAKTDTIPSITKPTEKILEKSVTSSDSSKPIEKPSEKAPVAAVTTPKTNDKIISPPIVTQKVVENSADKTASNKPVDKKDNMKTDVPKDTSANTAKPDDKKKLPSKPIELIVEALDSVEVEFSANTGKSEKIKLTPGQVHTIKSNTGVKLSLNNGGAVNLILNGKDIGVPGDIGRPLKINY